MTRFDREKLVDRIPSRVRVGLAVGVGLVWAAAAFGAEASTTSTQPIGWDDLPWTFLGIASLFGATGGVVYELIALEGNIEWPHLTRAEEVPAGGYGHAGLTHLFDLGILARVIIGAAAAIIVFWVLPQVAGVQLVAIALVAGSAGTAVFRSLQDRMVAALNAAKTETLTAGLQDLHGELAQLETAAATAAAAGLSSGFTSGGPTDVQAQAANIRGRVAALLEVGKGR